jgi:hypothetical protein
MMTALPHARPADPARPLHPGPGAVVWSRPSRSPHARHAGVAPSRLKGPPVSAFLFRPCSCCGRPIPLDRYQSGRPGCDDWWQLELDDKLAAEIAWPDRAEWRLRIGVGLALGASIAIAGLGWAALFRWLGWW